MAIPIVIGAGLWGFLITVVPVIVKFALRALGLGIVFYTGFSLALNQVEQYIFRAMSGLPSDMYQILSLAGFPIGIKILFTAFASILAVRAARGFAEYRARRPYTMEA